MRLSLLLSVIFVPFFNYAQNIIPIPNQVIKTGGISDIHREITIYAAEKEFQELIPLFVQSAYHFYGVEVKQVQSNSLIELNKDAGIQEKEAYRLTVNPDGIKVEAGHPAGCFYGLQSLLQLLNDYQEKGKTESMVIEDKPRFEWRGIMLDESRHFFGVEQVKQILDMMALNKLNIFHWHLTDVPGWRIEIKKYPRLTSVGGIGNHSDKNAPAQFYTQEQIKEIVEYARQRFIEVIPEIDMPGHATAAIKAYPEYSGGGSERYPEFTFNPGKEETYSFLTDILREVTTLFPSQYIHIGGDEVHFGNEQWASLKDVNDLMDRKNLKNLVEVEHYFLNRMADSIKSLGKTTVGWDEVVTAGLSSDNTLVMWWRHDKPQLLQQALNENYHVVLCPRIPLYFDFVQHNSHMHGRKWKGDFAPIESVYAFPAERFTGGIDSGNPLIKGIQGNVWTETIHTPERLQFMLYPRLSALAEAGWTIESRKDSAGFIERLKGMQKIFKKLDVQFFDIRNAGNQKEIKGPKN